MDWFLYDWDLRHERVKKIKNVPQVRYLVVYETLKDASNLCFKIYFKIFYLNVHSFIPCRRFKVMPKLSFFVVYVVKQTFQYDKYS